MSDKEKKPAMETQTAMGLDENLEALLSYVFVWVSGLVFLIIETKSKYVRFHALQSLITFLLISVIGIILRAIPVIGWFLGGIVIPVLAFVLWAVFMYMAFKGEKFKLPIIGHLCENMIYKTDDKMKG